MNKRTLILVLVLLLAGGAMVYFNFFSEPTSAPSSPAITTGPKVPAPAGKVAVPAPTPIQKDGAAQAAPRPEVRRIAVVYDAQAQRDPFAPLVMPKVATAKEEKKKGPALIGIYELAEIKLIGIVSQSGVGYGVLMTPDGRTYTVREGQTLGSSGEVFRITPNSLTIRDTFRDRKGAVRVKDTTLRLRTEEG